MSKLPIWARKPIHKKEVIATPIGWIVKDTGEVLKRVMDLDIKLKGLVTDEEVDTLDNNDISSNKEEIVEKIVESERVDEEIEELAVKHEQDEEVIEKATPVARKTTNRKTKRTKVKEESDSKE